MAADVVEGPDPVVSSAHHEEGLVGRGVLQVRAGLGEIVDTAGHLPYPAPEVGDLPVVDVAPQVAVRP